MYLILHKVNIMCYITSHGKKTQAGFGAWDLRVQEPKVWVARVQRVKEHMHDKINRAYSMLGIIKQNFKYLTIPTYPLRKI